MLTPAEDNLTGDTAQKITLNVIIDQFCFNNCGVTIVNLHNWNKMSSYTA